jgi:hypothetical protein
MIEELASREIKQFTRARATLIRIDSKLYELIVLLDRDGIIMPSIIDLTNISPEFIRDRYGILPVTCDE